jgi:hypothetical protein
MDQLGQITSIVENHIERLSARESSESLLNAPSVLLFRLIFPSIDRYTSCGDTEISK